jgi:hypothetical protein
MDMYYFIINMPVYFFNLFCPLCNFRYDSDSLYFYFYRLQIFHMGSAR